MTDQNTTRLGEIRDRVETDFVTDPESCASGLGQDLMQARVDRAALLSLVEQLQGQLDEQRWYGEQLQTSLDSCSGHHLPIEKYEAVPGDR